MYRLCKCPIMFFLENPYSVSLPLLSVTAWLMCSMILVVHTHTLEPPLTIFLSSQPIFQCLAFLLGISCESHENPVSSPLFLPLPSSSLLIPPPLSSSCCLLLCLLLQLSLLHQVGCQSVGQILHLLCSVLLSNVSSASSACCCYSLRPCLDLTIGLHSSSPCLSSFIILICSSLIHWA